jgi:outer membrane receptor protein involved in Fe transport
VVSVQAIVSSIALRNPTESQRIEITQLLFQSASETRKHWIIGIFVRNVANEKYNLTSSDISNPFGFLEPVEGPPRTYGFTVSHHF